MGRRGFALIELVVVLLLILVAMGAYFGLRGKPKPGELQGERSASGAESIPLRAMQKAESLACKSNLQQVRQSLQMDKDSGAEYPASLDQGATASVSKCPDSNQAYSYNPQTGQVWCTTPGHEKY